jgi:hypothetical protein
MAALGPPPVDIEPGTSGKPSVSCSSSAFCVAVDDLGYAFTYDASSWLYASTLALVGLPSDIDVNNATSVNGAKVTYQLPSATLGGSADPNASVTCTPQSGSPFPIGRTTVTCGATDPNADNSPQDGTFTVTVTGPPTATITAPSGGGTYNQGQVVPTTLSCADPYGPGIKSCADSNGTTGATGTLHGTLSTTTPGPNTYTVTATSGDGQTTTKSINYTIDNVTLTNPGSQSLTAHMLVSLQIHASSSAGYPISFSAAGLPPGLSIGSASGLISGSPDVPGIYNVSVTASDGWSGGSASVSFTLTVNPDTVTVTNPGAQTSVDLVATKLQIQATSAFGYKITYQATGLPAGLSINSSTGLISGVPTAIGSRSVTVTATDANGAQGSTTFSWNIIPPRLPLPPK